MTSDPTSMKSAEEDVLDVSAATQRRPDFCAEALSPRARLVLLLLALAMAVLSFVVILSLGLWPNAGLLALNELAGVLTTGLWVALTFVVFLVYGALLANNPRLSKAERIMWYVLFTIAGPISLPTYWFKEVLRVKYEPVFDRRLAPAREHASRPA
jgi:hypothetical protein